MREKHKTTGNEPEIVRSARSNHIIVYHHGYVKKMPSKKLINSSKEAGLNKNNQMTVVDVLDYSSTVFGKQYV